MNAQDVHDELAKTYPNATFHQGIFYLKWDEHMIVVGESELPSMDGIDLWNVARYEQDSDGGIETPKFMADVPAAAVLATVDSLTPETSVPTRVSIPGNVTATYEDGHIERIVFMPSGSFAGHFGPSAEVDEGDESLDVEDTDGPFWRAVQDYLAGNGNEITWAE